MAILIPEIEIINSFRTKLTEGERKLQEFLYKNLGDDWVIFVQINLNGKRPDLIAAHENHGIFIFEVKDWNLRQYFFKKDELYRNDGKDEYKVENPFEQVATYKNMLYKYELPYLSTETDKNKNFYAVIANIIYIHGPSKVECERFRELNLTNLDRSFQSDAKHTLIISDVDLFSEAKFLKTMKRTSNFSGILKKNNIIERLKYSFASSKQAKNNYDLISKTLTKKQEDLVNSNAAKQRAIGVAGSGKSFVIAKKAALALMLGKKVLVTYFNITMGNYLRDLIHENIRCLRGRPSQMDLIRVHIDVVNPARAVNKLNELEKKEKLTKKYKMTFDCSPYDMILVDEGQDFTAEDIHFLYGQLKEDHQFLIVEDDRQNIYGVDADKRRSLPGIKGKPNMLNESFRLPGKVIELCNYFIEEFKITNESGVVEQAKNSSRNLFSNNEIINFYFGDINKLYAKVIDNVIQSRQSGVPQDDICIMVCLAEQGRELGGLFNEKGVQCISIFETQDEFIENSMDKDILDSIRRAKKYEFNMQRGLIKLCTIHSFKGWEIQDCHILFDPNEQQNVNNIHFNLLYTAISRTQKDLSVYLPNNLLRPFSEKMATKEIIKVINVD